MLISVLKFCVGQVIWDLIFLCLQKFTSSLKILSGKLIIWGLCKSLSDKLGENC